MFGHGKTCPLVTLKSEGSSESILNSAMLQSAGRSFPNFATWLAMHAIREWLGIAVTNPRTCQVPWLAVVWLVVIQWFSHLRRQIELFCPRTQMHKFAIVVGEVNTHQVRMPTCS